MDETSTAGSSPVDRHVRALEGNRGTGRTTRQIKNAPNGAIFVWCNNRIDYPERLASELGRDDIEVVSPAWLVQGWIGRTLTVIVIDHAARLSDCEVHGLAYAEARVRSNVELSGCAASAQSARTPG